MGGRWLVVLPVGVLAAGRAGGGAVRWVACADVASWNSGNV